MKIGNTPLVELVNFEEKHKLSSKIFAKLEKENPAGSIKDRIAYEIISNYLENKKINKDTLLIEATSGNTGIGIAYVAREFGLKATIVMPSSMSKERIEFMEKYGAKVILSDKEFGMKGAIALANQIHEENKNSIIIGQFDNPLNPLAHYKHTGPEIYEKLPDVDIFVSAVGTGGTISGVGKFLKEKNPNVKIVAVEPLASPVISGGQPGKHKIQGIGAGFIPNTLNTKIIDEVIKVSDDDAFNFAKEIRNIDCLEVGISSGAALCGAYEIAKKYPNKKIVVIFPDGLDRYYSTDLYK